jgi:hypothetical protein
MKKLFTFLALIVITTINAQAPQGFNYQATVRNSLGALVTNQNVLFKFNIMLNSQTSLPVYSETHQAPTDDLGQVNLVIGTGTATTGTFAGINWASGTYYLGIELNTGSGFVAMGTTQLLSVPYALYANSAGTTSNYSKTTICLSGNITNAQAAAKIAAQLGPDTENILIANTNQLTTVDLSSVSNIINITIENNSSLTSINFGGLTTIEGTLRILSNQALSNLSFSSLLYCGNVEAYDGLNFNLNLSSLTTCNSLNVSGIANFTAQNLTNCNTIQLGDIYNLTTITFPSLTNCNQIELYNSLLTSISFPTLTSCDINIYYNTLLISVSFPSLTSCNFISISNNALLTSVSFPALTNSKNFNLSYNALTTTSINSLLHKMLTVSPSAAKSINLINQTPEAPPTGQGLIDKQTLINAGNSVITD